MIEKSEENWLRETWPLHKRELQQLALYFVVVVAVGSALGFLLTDLTAPNVITEFDQDLAADVVDARTEGGDANIHWGAFPADTLVKAGASLLLGAVLLAYFKRWHEAVFVGLTLTFEALSFTAITYIVQRPRPDVDRLVDSPVSTSFPSGHAAAATVYLALAVIVFWHTRNWAYRTAALLVTGSIPLIVGAARIYQGMHYLSDVLAGFILGLVTVALCHKVMGPPSGSIYQARSTVRDEVSSDRGRSREVLR